MFEKIDIKRAVSLSRKVKFVKTFNGELTYETEFGEQFVVPPEDTKGAVFLAEDKAIMFMRWMRKWNSDLG